MAIKYNSRVDALKRIRKKTFVLKIFNCETNCTCLVRYINSEIFFFRETDLFLDFSLGFLSKISLGSAIVLEIFTENQNSEKDASA